jgi:hypothetical protein
MIVAKRLFVSSAELPLANFNCWKALDNVFLARMSA